jgi:hypothetical protein
MRQRPWSRRAEPKQPAAAGEPSRFFGGSARGSSKGGCARRSLPGRPHGQCRAGNPTAARSSRVRVGTPSGATEEVSVAALSHHSRDLALFSPSGSWEPVLLLPTNVAKSLKNRSAVPASGSSIALRRWKPSHMDRAPIVASLVLRERASVRPFWVADLGRFGSGDASGAKLE